jgi:hypothetical protein
MQRYAYMPCIAHMAPLLALTDTCPVAISAHVRMHMSYVISKCPTHAHMHGKRELAGAVGPALCTMAHALFFTLDRTSSSLHDTPLLR